MDDILVHTCKNYYNLIKGTNSNMYPVKSSAHSCPCSPTFLPNMPFWVLVGMLNISNSFLVPSMRHVIVMSF